MSESKTQAQEESPSTQPTEAEAEPKSSAAGEWVPARRALMLRTCEADMRAHFNSPNGLLWPGEGGLLEAPDWRPETQGPSPDLRRHGGAVRDARIRLAIVSVARAVRPFVDGDDGQTVAACELARNLVHVLAIDLTLDVAYALRELAAHRVRQGWLVGDLEMVVEVGTRAASRLLPREKVAA